VVTVIHASPPALLLVRRAASIRALFLCVRAASWADIYALGSLVNGGVSLSMTLSIWRLQSTGLCPQGQPADWQLICWLWAAEFHEIARLSFKNEMARVMRSGKKRYLGCGEAGRWWETCRKMPWD
jgi:hypothetical protein